VVKFWQKRVGNYANPFMRENTRGYRRKTVNLHVELVSDVLLQRFLQPRVGSLWEGLRD
jgi:hypothetical protein